MKTPVKTLIVLSIFMLVQCKNSKQPASVEYQQIAEQRLGSNIQYSPNGDRSMILCYKQQKDQSNGGYGVSFFVFDNKLKKIIYEEVIDRGTVDWYSDNEVVLFYTPGTMRSDQSRDDFSYIYNLVSKEKRLKSKL
ncbi:MAG: hypothetical protein GY816_13955 [Cytophagales bacterium]|nr:hypothetical protein [Cytophagales bacterium]